MNHFSIRDRGRAEIENVYRREIVFEFFYFYLLFDMGSDLIRPISFFGIADWLVRGPAFF